MFSIIQKGYTPFVIEIVLLVIALVCCFKFGGIFENRDHKGPYKYLTRLISAVAIVLPFILRLNEFLYSEERYNRKDNLPGPAAILVGALILIAVNCIYECIKGKDTLSIEQRNKIIVESVISFVLVIVLIIIISKALT